MTDTKRLKEIFSEYLDLLDERKNLNEQIKELVDEAERISGYKKKIIRKAFAFLKKQYENGDDEFDDVASLIISLKEGNN